ncbi:MAG: DNRLRE domain-containing protein, partial [candidate division Zixibacteria bacterium]|nr:DNRLRE domain-containing protein [candidate division Zixibacteria bacterium]
YETTLRFYADMVELIPSDSLVFYPTQDATVDQIYPNNTHGLEDWLVARRGGTGFRLDALVQFDLNTIPTGAAIDSATLGFYYDHYQDGNPSGKNLTVHLNTGSWNESTVTWNNAPGYNATVIASSTVPGSASWMEWDVTNSVQDMVDGVVSNDGWRVIDPSGGGYFSMIYFPSKEYVTIKPYLRIVRKTVAFDCVPGDADGSGSSDIDDVVYLITYIFSGGPTPTPYEICSGDADCSCTVDIDDVTYLIAYIFMSGPAPCDCDEWVTLCDLPLRVTFDGDEDGAALGEEQVFSKTVAGSANLSLVSTKDGLRTDMLTSIDADREVQALQLEYEIRGDVRGIKVQSLVEGIQEFHGIADNVLKVGLLDLQGQAMIPAGGAEIINISFVGDGEIELVSSIAVARTGGRLNTTRNSLVADAIVPKSYVLQQNKPNPFNPATEISFTLPSPSHVKLDVFNILGQNVKTLIDGYRPAGDHTVTWEGRHGNGGPAASGVYFYRIEAGNFTKCKKMLLLK